MIAAAMSADAQWTMQQSHATASLRGVHNVGGGVVWASGTEGTVLHTTDGGEKWQSCAVPPGAEKLDFRGVQAFDANTALVMSSGSGDLSRIYKTIDGCRTWKLVFTNPDASGFWDAMRFSSPRFGVLIGDQVGGHFPVFVSSDMGDTWRRLDPAPFSPVDKNQSFFAASNTSLVLDDREKKFYMITGGGATGLITAGPHVSFLHAPRHGERRDGWRILLGVESGWIKSGDGSGRRRLQEAGGKDGNGRILNRAVACFPDASQRLSQCRRLRRARSKMDRSGAERHGHFH